MIPNIVIPMPIYTHGGNADNKTLVAILLAFGLISLCIYLCGYLYEGIKHNDWSISNDDNQVKMWGGLMLIVTLFVGVFALVALKIYEML